MIYKQNKLLRTVKEFERVGNKYNINGIDLNEAIFFWRISQQLYDVIPKGSYNITTEGNNTYLNITDTTFNYERIQISYLFASISSEYEVDFNVDINILKDRYNEAVEDIKKIYAYVKSNIMIADGQDVTMILPSLGKNEVWVKTDDGYRGFDIGDLEHNIAEQIKEFEKLVADSLQALEDKGDEIENNIIDQGTTQVDRIDAQASQVNDSLDIMWRMYRITTGANRYLSGNNIENRDNTKLDREVIGGDITQRSGQPRKVYFGGNIADRAIVNALNIDLGSSRG